MYIVFVRCMERKQKRKLVWKSIENRSGNMENLSARVQKHPWDIYWLPIYIMLLNFHKLVVGDPVLVPKLEHRSLSISDGDTYWYWYRFFNLSIFRRFSHTFHFRSYLYEVRIHFCESIVTNKFGRFAFAMTSVIVIFHRAVRNWSIHKFVFLSPSKFHLCVVKFSNMLGKNRGGAIPSLLNGLESGNLSGT